MSDTPSSFRIPASGEAGRQVAQFRNALMLVEQIAGDREAEDPGDTLIAESARIDAAYEHASPVVQRRFNAQVSEIALWTAVGVEVLISARERDTPSSAAAGRLARELRRALGQLSRTLGDEGPVAGEIDRVLADQP